MLPDREALRGNRRPKSGIESADPPRGSNRHRKRYRAQTGFCDLIEQASGVAGQVKILQAGLATFSDGGGSGLPCARVLCRGETAENIAGSENAGGRSEGFVLIATCCTGNDRRRLNSRARTATLPFAPSVFAFRFEGGSLRDKGGRRPPDGPIGRLFSPFWPARRPVLYGNLPAPRKPKQAPAASRRRHHTGAHTMGNRSLLRNKPQNGLTRCQTPNTRARKALTQLAQ